MSCSDGPRRHTADEAAGSAIYECGYNSCGCNLKWSEVRSGSFGVDLGPVWGPSGPEAAPNRPQTTPTGPDLGQPQNAAT
jgi:hypothetical protein